MPEAWIPVRSCTWSRVIPWAPAKILGRFGLKQRVYKQSEYQSMHGKLGQRMECAHNDMECDRSHGKPASPVMSPEHVHANYSSDESHDANEDKLVRRRVRVPEIWKVKHQPRLGEICVVIARSLPP